MKLFLHDSRINARAYSFPVSVVTLWNRLPAATVLAQNLKQFKIALRTRQVISFVCMYFILFCALFFLRFVMLSFVLAMLKRRVPALAIQFRYCVYLVHIVFTLSSCGLIN